MTAGTCSGQPRIDGTRIRVLDVYVWHELQGRSADEIVEDFPQLSMADVYAALSYFWEHRDEMQAEFDRQRQEFESLRSTHSSPSARLGDQLGAPHAADDSISS